MRAEKRNKAVLVGLILTFTIPLILAGLLFWLGSPFDGKTTNYGDLLQPTTPISQLAPTDINQQPLVGKAILGKWVLLTVSPGVCGKPCEKSLYSVRQICKATGKAQTRLRQVVLTFKGKNPDSHLKNLLASEYPKTVQWVVEANKFKAIAADAANQTTDTQQGAIYFIDPLGNIMMRYSPDANPTGIFKDLSKLLRVSQIG